ncbi:MAG TPA: O-antigen ligase family protein [Cytophagales bacterium]|nr:O-antigen ligase family protein [Cytophagales bacterium]
MKISYGSNTLINFSYAFLVIIILVLLTDGIFLELLVGERPEGQPLAFTPDKFLLPLAFLIAIISFFRQESFMRKTTFLALIYFSFLILESLYYYNQVMVYPHVFTKLMVLFVVPFVYVFFREVKQSKMKLIVYAILIAFFLDLILYKTEVLSFSSFVDTKRGFSAASTYLLLFAGIYFFNKYMEKGSTADLLLFLVVMGFVAFLQHRSVWIAAVVALFFNVLFLYTKSQVKIGMKFIPIILIPLFSIFIVGALVLIDNPEIAKTFERRFDDILNFKEEGTGSWRYEQFLSYWPFVEDAILTGQRFKGFELPIQFYHPDAGTPYFNDGTGHHFHSFYLDKLFYLGIIGTIIVILPVLYFFYKVFKKKSLTTEELVLASFLISIFAFGFSYNWPVFIYGLTGIGCAFIEQEEGEEEQIEEVSNTENKIKFEKELV